MTYKSFFSGGFIILLLLSGNPEAIAQATGYQPSEERSSFQERRKSILDANNVRATYHNHGFAGPASGQPDELPFEYPKNTNRRYIYFVTVFVGAEVNNQLPGSNNRFPIVAVPNYRTNPSTGASWAFNPIANVSPGVGYYAEGTEEIARSDRGPDSQAPIRNTWPDRWADKLDDESDPGWPDQWNGFFGKDIFNADQEFYYRSGDDLYTRYHTNASFRFFPDETDPTRGGLGLILDARILAWTQNLISNVHFNIYEVRNDASFDYNKVSFMLWTADWVGTPQDDRPFFDQQRATAYFTDTRPTASPPEFDGTSIGVAGVRFLETPGNAIDGIDNDGDSDFYIPESPTGLYDPRNVDLIADLVTTNGGFFANRTTIVNEVIPQFTPADFAPRTIGPGDKIVLIDENFNRILTRYPVSADTVTIISQGREIKLPPNGLTVREDTLLGRHLNLLDDNFNGLIDENQPNHLTLSRLIGANIVTRPVRFINYLWDGYYDNISSFADRDTIQRGLIVPNSWIRDRMQNDASFATQVNDYQDMLRNLYFDRFEPSHFDNYFQNHHTSAPMIDESRDDFFDNNNDWRAASDDVGRDGVEGTGSRGEGNGFPTSGAFTGFPGESNIDKTDVRETDAIGISSATFRPAGGLNLSQLDSDVWTRHMVPGIFSAAPDAAQDTDQFIASSFFQLQRGAIERFAVAVTIAQANTPTNTADIELVEQQLAQAFNAYDANYQFAIAPPPPRVRAVPGDGFVTLYWDDIAEFVFDRYLDRLGVNPNNFEGYKIYRSTDPALLDSRTVTDGRGTLQFLKPIVQFDRINGITGNHPIEINGMEFYLGDDSGIQRQYTDTEVINGRTYYYVVVAYNNGAPTAGIAPSESPINLSLNPDGSISAGVNVLRVVAGKLSAGYVGPEDPVVSHTGTSTGTVIARIIDPKALKPNNAYEVTFNDTTINSETFAWSFNLRNVTTDTDLLINREELAGEDVPVAEGIQMIVVNPGSSPKLVTGGWSTQSGIGVPATISSTAHTVTDHSYAIVFGSAPESGLSANLEIGRGNLIQRMEPISVIFKVLNLESGNEVPFAFSRNARLSKMTERESRQMGAIFDDKSQRTHSDQIYLKELVGGIQTVTWQIALEPYEHNVIFRPMPGDTLFLIQNNVFNSGNVYTFTIQEGLNTATEDLSAAKSALSNVKVVPNPYIVTNEIEPRPTIARPNQLRQLMFTNLPARCTIRIFNVAGHLIQTIQVSNSTDVGYYVWDMLTKDNLELSYGVYIYHVDAPGVGEKVGKFAVIK